MSKLKDVKRRDDADDFMLHEIRLDILTRIALREVLNSDICKDEDGGTTNVLATKIYDQVKIPWDELVPKFEYELPGFPGMQQRMTEIKAVRPPLVVQLSKLEIRFVLTTLQKLKFRPVDNEWKEPLKAQFEEALNTHARNQQEPDKFTDDNENNEVRASDI